MKSKLKVLGMLLVSMFVFFACGKDEDKPTPQPEKVVKFADANFKKNLLENTELNINKDNEIQEKEALAFTGKINVKGKELTNLTDLQFFPNITELDCSNNNLTTLNLSKNTKLTAVYCQHNKIKGAGTTTATKGQTDENTIWTLSANTELKILDCSYNQLVSIDLSKNTKLENVDCSHNIELVSLNVANGNNAVLKILNATNTPKLKTILVDEEKAQNPPKEWKKDEETTYNNKKSQPYIELTTTKAVGETIKLAMKADEQDKKDIWIDLNNNGTRDEGEKVTKFNEGEKYPEEAFGTYKLKSQTIRVYGKVNDFYTYTYFDEEKGVNIGEEITKIDVSHNKYLFHLLCNYNKIKELDVSQNIQLEILSCMGNQLSHLDVSKNTKLEWLSCFLNQLSSLDVSKNTKLQGIVCGNNHLTSLDISQNVKIEYLYCSGNQISSLDVSKNTELFTFFCDNNHLTSLDVSNCSKLGTGEQNAVLFYCINNPNLTCIKVSQEQLDNTDKSWVKDDTATYSIDCGN